MNASRRRRALGRRWRLSRQIGAVFTVAMLVNALIIVVTTGIVSDRLAQKRIETMPPAALRAWKDVSSGVMPNKTDLERLAQFSGELTRAPDESDYVLLLLVVGAAVVTLIVGHVAFGSLGEGLSNVASAARRIATGDMSARASSAGRASFEEAQLTTDFNAMARSLQRAERELAEGTAAIAHELRTPLTILRGRLQGMIDGVFATGSRELGGLALQVDGLSRLVDDLQTLSLAGARRLALTVDMIDLSDEVDAVLTTYGAELQQHGLHPLPFLDPAPLQADAARIRQVIGGVLANACRYAPDSGAIRLATYIDGDEAVLEIADQGPGLPDGASDFVFDRFWRAEPSRNRRSGGTGLGLAVARAIIEAHGGTASLTNHSSGTIFAMRLPAASPHSQA